MELWEVHLAFRPRYWEERLANSKPKKSMKPMFSFAWFRFSWGLWCGVRDLFFLKKKTPKNDGVLIVKRLETLIFFESSMEKSYLFKSKSAWFRLFSVKQTSQSQNTREQIGSGEYGNDFVPMESSIKRLKLYNIKSAPETLCSSSREHTKCQKATFWDVFLSSIFCVIEDDYFHMLSWLKIMIPVKCQRFWVAFSIPA